MTTASNTSLPDLPAWKGLVLHQQSLREKTIAGLFKADSGRFKELSFSLPGLLVDFSKNMLTGETLQKLILLAEARDLKSKTEAFFRGEKINTTENRAVLHTALRAPAGSDIRVDGENVVPAVQDTLSRMATFSRSVRDGAWKGHSGKEITDIVNIGIGGSSLGPQLVAEALSYFHHPRLRCHFVANVEASDLARVLASVSPETTLFIVASKTFTTAETMQNARIARDWLLQKAGGDKTAVAKHFVAASTNRDAVTAFGIDAQNMFPFSDWVGGRYSVWSSIGLSLMLMIGPDAFGEFLAGAAAMDTHFRTAPFMQNIPVLMALIGLWHRDFFDYPAYAVIPYHALLKRLPAFLQQLDMESNGKSVLKNGTTAPVKTGPMIFGEPGTDAQHSFFQWLHQSPDVVPVDFIAAVKTPYGVAEQQKMLLANLLAQSEALMLGKESPTEPHRHFNGNRPSTIILLDELTPRTLGLLLALYEHKVFVQGAIWDINSFDQWGVELGKILAKTIEKDLSGTAAPHDASTTGLIAYIRKELA